MIANAVFWGYQITPKRSTKEDEAVQYFDDEFFDLLRLVTFFQSCSSYLHSFVLSDMNCNAELGINFFRHAVPKGGREGGGCLGVALDGMVNRYPLLLLPRGLPPFMHCIGIVGPKGMVFSHFGQIGYQFWPFRSYTVNGVWF